MKQSLYLLLCILFLAGCKGHPHVGPDEYIIEGFIKDLPDSSVIRLLKPDGRVLRPVASDTAVGGHFFFRDTLSATMQFSIIGQGAQFPGTFVDLWTAPGSYTAITGNGCNIRTWKYDNDVPEQQNVNAMLQATRADWEIVGNSMIEERKWFDVLDKNRDNDSICQQARQKVDSIRKKNNLLRERIVVKEMEVLNQMPVSSWWLSVMEKYAPMIQFAPDHPVIPYLLEAAGKMTDSDRQTPSGKVIMSYINLPEAVSVGDDMADGDLYDIDGNLHHLSELKGKYILLDFWSLGCGPCVASIPEVEEVAGLYAAELAVVGISEDGEESWKEFIRKKNLKGIQWNQLGKSSPTLNIFYRVDGVPCYVLISPEGKVVDKWAGYYPNSLKDRMKKVFKK